MKIDATLPSTIAQAGPAAAEFEAANYDGVWTAETAHDPFLPLVAAASSLTAARTPYPRFSCFNIA